MNANTYDVYLGIYIGNARDHHAIWIDTRNTEQLPDDTIVIEGVQVQVTGDIRNGMSFEVKKAVDPVTSIEGKEKVKIGTIQKGDLQRLIQICQSLPPPGKQFKGLKKVDPKKPLYRCQDWTAEAIKLLLESAILRPETS